MKFSAIIPFLLAINILLVAYGVIPRRPKNPKGKEYALKKFGLVGKIIGYFFLVFGIIIVLLQLKIIMI